MKPKILLQLLCALIVNATFAQSPLLCSSILFCKLFELPV